MMPRVSFPMYDLPGLEAVWDLWWLGLRRHLVRAGLEDFPERRTRLPELADHWSDRKTVLTHTCGYPFVRGLAKTWRLVATPCFDVPWCEGSSYRNLVVVSNRCEGVSALEDLRGHRVAYNGSDSHSGYNSLRSMIAPLARDGCFFSETVRTGSHLMTLNAIQSGAADCGSVDCVTLALIEKHGIAPTDDLFVLCGGPLVPGLPLIAPRGKTADSTVEAYRSALEQTSQDPEMKEVNAELLLTGFSVREEDEYAEILNLQNSAAALGYSVIG